MIFKKYFTPRQANKALPLVKQIVADILGKARDVKALTAGGINPSNQSRYEKLLSDMDIFSKELEELGCFFKDWDFTQGLVDFPAMIDGKEVLLCWRSDESDIRWYHSLEDGFPGRLPIPENLLADSDKMLKADTGPIKM